jgi:hypothetical protein
MRNHGIISQRSYMLPPDYWSQMQNPDIMSVMVFIVKFYSMMFVFMVLNVAMTVSFVWSLLIICRVLRIPWIDGTTKGFINRE